MTINEENLNKEIKSKYSLTNNAFKLDSVKNAELDRLGEEKDKIEVIVGDDKQPDTFLPQVKLCRWNNEVNFSIRLVDEETGQDTITTEADKLKWSKGNLDIEYYDFVEGEGGYKMVWYLKNKPKTNKLNFTIQSKDLDFFYQPELTQEEINQGISRPENVIGSYAVYHKKKGGINDKNGKEYKIGKAFHIYRPHIIDANGAETWGILNIKDGIYSVEIPQEFLDKAVYPIKSNDTFGYTSEGAGGLRVYATFCYSLPNYSGAISKLSFCGCGDWQSDLWKALVLSIDDLDNLTLHGVGIETECPYGESSGDAEWFDSSFSSGISITANTRYYLGAISNDMGYSFIKYDSGQTNQTRQSTATYSNITEQDLEDNLDTKSPKSYILSVYATFTPAELEGTQYYWRIRAKDSVDWGEWSSTFRFGIEIPSSERGVEIIGNPETKDITDEVLNPSFEDITDDWADNWETIDETAFTIDTGGLGCYPTKTNSLKINGSATGKWTRMLKDIAVDDTKSYVFKCYVDLRTVSSGNLKVKIEEFDDERMPIDTITVKTYTEAETNYCVYSYTPTEDTTRINIHFELNGEVLAYIDNVQFYERSLAKSGAKVSITFDDGLSNVYTNKSIFTSRGIPISWGIISSVVGTSIYASWSDILDVYTNYGWEIVNHSYSHQDLTTLNESQITDEIEDCALAIQTNIGKYPVSFFYPYGAYNNLVKRVCARFALTGRQGWYVSGYNLIPYNNLELKVFEVENDTTVQNVLDEIDDAITGEYWLILLYHGLVDSSPSQYQWLVEDMEDVLDYIETKVGTEDIKALTVEEAMDLLEEAGESVNSEKLVDISGAEISNSEKLVDISGQDDSNSEKLVEVNTSNNSYSEKLIDISGKNITDSEKLIDLIGEDNSVSEKLIEIFGNDSSVSEKLIELIGDKGELSEKLIEVLTEDNTESEKIIDITGKNTSQAERLVDLTGKIISTSDRLVEISAIDSSNSERLVDLAGQDNSTSERVIDLEGIPAKQQYTEDRGIEILSCDKSSAERQIEANTIGLGSSEKLIEATGNDSSDSERLVDMSGQDFSNSERDIELLVDIEANTSQKDIELSGIDTTNSEKFVDLTGREFSDSEKAIEMLVDIEANSSQRNIEVLVVDTSESDREIEISGIHSINSEKEIEILTDIEANTSERDIEILVDIESNISERLVEVIADVEANISEKLIEISGEDFSDTEKEIILTGKIIVDNEKYIEINVLDSNVSEKLIDITGKIDVSSEKLIEANVLDSSTSEKTIDLFGRLLSNTEKVIEINTIDSSYSEKELEVEVEGGAYSQKDIELSGVDTTETEKEIETTGRVIVSSERGVELYTENTAEAEREVDLTGRQFSNSERLIILDGENTSYSEREVELLVENYSNSERDIGLVGKIDLGNEKDIELIADIEANVSERSIDLIGKIDIGSEKAIEMLVDVEANISEKYIELTGQDTTQNEKSIDLIGRIISISEKDIILQARIIDSNEKDIEIPTDIEDNISIKDIEITGKIDISSEKEIEIKGQIFSDSEKLIELIADIEANTSQKDIILIGKLSDIDDKNIELFGRIILASEKFVELNSFAQANKEKGIELVGSNDIINERIIETEGINEAYSERGTEILTDVEANISEREIELKTRIIVDKEKAVELSGIDTDTSEKNCILTGALTGNSEKLITLEGIYSGISTRDIVIKVIPRNPYCKKANPFSKKTSPYSKKTSPYKKVKPAKCSI